MLAARYDDDYDDIFTEPDYSKMTEVEPVRIKN